MVFEAQSQNLWDVLCNNTTTTTTTTNNNNNNNKVVPVNKNKKAAHKHLRKKQNEFSELKR